MNSTRQDDPRSSKTFTSRSLRCSVCGRGPAFAKDRKLEQTGVCANCSARQEGKS